MFVQTQPKFVYGAWKGDSIRISATCHVCPFCAGPTIDLNFSNLQGTTLIETVRAFPRSGAFEPPPPEVPVILAKDYSEANQVLSISPKASAALARRCLQFMLQEAGYKSDNLAKQVQAAIDEQAASKALPADLRDSLDAIRNFGNFSAHPVDDKTTLQVIDVEVGEAEWSLQLIFDLFQHYYVRPARSAHRRAMLNEKLASAGKPPIKAGAAY
ncbi:DUF4145 domain-containing protein [Novosphingobium sp. MMS21-SN21R]|uniref:DUF4145 domain-containing protein n=1 Tax=Novosphingobium sp. MMS21-SN21R TaxID=2969298 RepID=UPI0028851314|nr:DUF4145 domain-containing protein [Novosphingobium sp. MMS21-SN21R]MDT0506660.1 DUF4145 domain-containing protein [Novosphingobium sp. MMS21-SN21R]